MFEASTYRNAIKKYDYWEDVLQARTVTGRNCDLSSLKAVSAMIH